MATVHVNTWDEFVSAVGVSGDTVVLPEGDLEWDMNEILPYGLTQDVTIACHMIEGNNFRIKNLNLNSYKFMYSGQDIKYFRNLKCTDWIGTNVFFFLRFGSNFYCCTISGITSNNYLIDCSNSYSYSSANFISCSINIESSNDRFQLVSSGAGEFFYSRLEVHAPNISDTSYLTIGQNAIYCELIIYAPNLTGSFYPSDYNGSTIRGDLKRCPKGITGIYGFTGQTVVYLKDTFSESFENPSPNHFIACTEEQFKDAAFLRSKGFPIIVDGGD